ncbi:SET domain-containing protein-lysine N-methyltransferase [Gelidibacter sp. F63206]|uniref:SET domain-containing protein-lysine N-methyltransferase n=1 Tax=Gelidibacter sp. F63206 TaxID=2926425 RepID=UPI001FF28B05|nr:SET domain-containing protein-lysine N-methyltransferase [Gelidibacter sp. F63206]MCK0114440.1 SET domain-containing protein-lysine N-methyltransferase [Gelidibacter sp. F63206]
MKGALYIKEVKGKGRGVFSSAPIVAGDIVESCKMLVFHPEDYDLSTASFLINYSFFIDRDRNIVGLASGFGSLYNHAAPANATHKIYKEYNRVDIVALRDIANDEEICINYHGAFDDPSTSWFDNRGLEYHP